MQNFNGMFSINEIDVSCSTERSQKNECVLTNMTHKRISGMNLLGFVLITDVNVE